MVCAETIRFDSLPVHAVLLDRLKELPFATMFPVQVEAIPLLLRGVSVCVAAKTGSGKTLAFLIPVVNQLLRLPVGVIGAMVVAPTRELATQIHSVALRLLRGTERSAALFVGGVRKREDRPAELIIGTPGRLVDHILTSHLEVDGVGHVVLDEADRLLEGEMRGQVLELVKRLPSAQLSLFSATVNDDLRSFARTLRADIEGLSVGDEEQAVTVAGLSHKFVLCPNRSRLDFLLYFLQRQRDCRVIVYFSSRDSAKFHAQLLRRMNLGVVIFWLSGERSLEKRLESFRGFASLQAGVLLSTDVGSRGLDIPGVPWVLQFDPPSDERGYVHRVGRVARAGRPGKSLLLLAPDQVGFVKRLARFGAKPSELKVDLAGHSYERVVRKALDRPLQKRAKEALRSCLMALDSHAMSDYFSPSHTDLVGLAWSFGFDEFPPLDIPISDGGRKASWVEQEKRMRGQ